VKAAPAPDPTIGTRTGTLAGHLRSRLLAGETLEVGKIAAELGIPYNKVRHGVNNLMQTGLAIERIGKLGQGRYRLGTPKPKPKPKPPPAKRTPARATTRTAATTSTRSPRIADPDDGQDPTLTLTPRRRGKVNPADAPMLGARLEVVALAKERGEIVIRLEGRGQGELYTAVLRQAPGLHHEVEE
jgi:hypothetical protein